MTEPGAGSAVTELTTTATPDGETVSAALNSPMGGQAQS
jgi:alkylation response protein AidB-like acyl-CoA dehydrogenase